MTEIASLSVQDYLRIEEHSLVRQEFIGRQLFAVPESNETHNVIVGNITACLKLSLRGSGCYVYALHLKLLIEAKGDVYYPDVMATCERFVAKSLFKSNPFLLVEVLSPSTANIDRREKLSAYRLIESVREYVIVYQDYQRVELYRKDETGSWQFAILGEGDKLLLESLPTGPLLLTMDEIYEDVNFAESANEPE